MVEDLGETPISDIEIGLIDAMQGILEMVMALGVPSTEIGELFRSQADAHRAAGRGDAGFVLEVLRRYATDPELARRRLERRIVQSAPPQGRA